MHAIRIIEIPDCQMVSSGIGMFGEPKFDGFAQWFSSLPQIIYAKNFLFHDGDEESGTGGFHWLYLYEEGMKVPAEYDIINFKGGLYAVATDIDQQTDVEAMNKALWKFIDENGFELDKSRSNLGNISTSQKAQETMRYAQMDYFYPIKIKGE